MYHCIPTPQGCGGGRSGHKLVLQASFVCREGKTVTINLLPQQNVALTNQILRLYRGLSQLTSPHVKQSSKPSLFELFSVWQAIKFWSWDTRGHMVVSNCFNLQTLCVDQAQVYWKKAVQDSTGKDLEVLVRASLLNITSHCCMWRDLPCLPWHIESTENGQLDHSLHHTTLTTHLHGHTCLLQCVNNAWAHTRAHKNGD